MDQTSMVNTNHIPNPFSIYRNHFDHCGFCSSSSLDLSTTHLSTAESKVHGTQPKVGPFCTRGHKKTQTGIFQTVAWMTWWNTQTRRLWSRSCLPRTVHYYLKRSAKPRIVSKTSHIHAPISLGLDLAFLCAFHFLWKSEKKIIFFQKMRKSILLVTIP